MKSSLTLLHIILSFLFLLGAATLSLIFTRICISALPLFGMIDIPHGRHQHKHSVPRGGGIAIMLSFVCMITVAIYCLNTAGLAMASKSFLLQFGPSLLVIGILGILDDKYELKSYIKLFIQIAVALYFYFTGAGIIRFLEFPLPVWISLPLTVCWVVGIINAFNLIDGMDGVAAGLASISAFSMAIWVVLSGGSILMVMCMMTFCGACLGFLKYNFSPARIFMGDTGSLFIGLFFAYFSMAESSKAITLTSILVPVLAMGIPIFDVFLAITRRLFLKYVKKQPGAGIMVGDHDHLHHRLQEQLQNPKKTAFYLYMLAVLLVTGAIIAALVSNVLQTLSFAILLCIIFAVVRFATIEFYDAASLISNGIRIPHKSLLLIALHPVVDMLLLILAYMLSSYLFDLKLSFSTFTLKKAFCYLAPFPIILTISGIYKTYWLRTGISRYYRLLVMLLISAVIALALVLIFTVYHFGKNPAQIQLMQQFFALYVIMGISFIFLERFTLHFVESYYFCKLQRLTTAERNSLEKTVIYGGGLYCKMFLISQNTTTNDQPVRDVIGIIDDNLALRRLNVYGKNVIGTSYELSKLLRKYHFTEIVIALRNIPELTKRKIYRFGRENNIKIREFYFELK